MSGEREPPARIFLVEDHPAVRRELARMLTQEGFTVCGEAAQRIDALERLGAARPDLAIVDLSVGDGGGLALIADLGLQNVPVLVYSLHEGPLGIERALAAGAAGYVSKREPTETLVQAIGAVLAGRTFVAPRAARSLASRREGPPP